MAALELPSQQPLLRITTMPNDANAKGDIFGGWLMSKMDIAGSVLAIGRTKGQVATVAVKELRFMHPLYIYDLVSFYGDIVSVGHTSVTVAMKVYAQHLRENINQVVQVGEGTFVYVAIDAPGVKRVVPTS